MHVPSEQETGLLWTPPGVEKLAPTIAGESLSGPVVIHTFRFHSEKYGKTREVRIPANPAFLY